MSKYNAVAEALLVPFDESDITQRLQNPKKDFHEKYNPIFSYVTPEKYRYRLLETFTNGYEFGIIPGTVVFGKEGVFAIYNFKGSVGEVRYDITVPVFEEYSYMYDYDAKQSTDKKINLDKQQNAMTSAALKAISTNLGLGLHLYDKTATQVNGGEKAPETAKAASGSSTRSAASGASQGASNANDSDWDGTAKVTFGKHKGKPYSEVDEGWLSWAANKTNDEGEPNPDKGSVRELARRKSTAGAAAQQSASAGVDDEGEFPFD